MRQPTVWSRSPSTLALFSLLLVFAGSSLPVGNYNVAMLKLFFSPFFMSPERADKCAGKTQMYPVISIVDQFSG